MSDMIVVFKSDMQKAGWTSEEVVHPLYDDDTGYISGANSFRKWKHPQYGEVSGAYAFTEDFAVDRAYFESLVDRGIEFPPHEVV
jgi:hypothetical protein